MTSDPVARYLSQRGAKFDRKYRLRIMSSGEVLDTALRIYQRFGLTFLRLTVAPALLCLAATGFVQEYVLPQLFVTKSTGGPAQLIDDVAGALAMAVFVGGPLFLLGVSYSSAAVVHMVSDYMNGKTPDPDAAAIAARSVLPRIFLVNLKELCISVSGIVLSTIVMALGGYLSTVTSDSDFSAGLVAVVGILGLIVGGIIFLYIVAYDALVVPIAVMEGLGARRTSLRSRTLIKRVGYHPSGINTVVSAALLIGFIALVLYLGFAAFSQILDIPTHISEMLSSIPGKPLFIQAFDLIPSYLILWMLTPVWATVITIVYYERKIRLEGYDIDVLAAEIPKRLR